MKKVLLSILLVNIFLFANGSDKPGPLNPPNEKLLIKEFAHLTPGEYEKMTGKKLKLKQKIALKIYQWKLKRQLKSEVTAKQKRQGILSLIFGGISILATLIAIAAFLPGVILIGAGSAIAGLILGIKSVKGNNSNTVGILGITLNVIALSIFTLGLMALITSSVK